ncbi:MAG TPA: twitching motility protein PilT [Chromatiales bacterium]|nr:twitching motility protein PilT [Thiotrichales bacterium]HIP67370.1 twitching motility protein PilT [Chromatiales bacterium]
MARIQLRFYEELNDFLPVALRKVEFTHDITRKASVKDVIESFGVPHPEVEIILVNGKSVDFSYIVQNGDRISVYPMFESLDISSLLQLRPRPLRLPHFIVDANLGALARYLRLLGIDCLYQNNYSDNEVATISDEQQRTVLTRDRTLLQRKIITHGYFVRADKPLIQTKEVLKRFDLYRSLAPFTRCTRCNGILKPVEKESIMERLEPLTKKYYDDFLICPDCQQIYWEGSHQQRAKILVNELMKPQSNNSTRDGLNKSD